MSNKQYKTRVVAAVADVWLCLTVYGFLLWAELQAGFLVAFVIISIAFWGESISKLIGLLLDLDTTERLAIRELHQLRQAREQERIRST
ncbi:MAG: hypothetical protein QM520_00420 [Gammaproteobacteria bacterium]|nr:hypothetical protein [Gammaproteobacteria bacterium]